MNTRFNVDLLHPGWVVRNWYDWFIDPRGTRRLALFAIGCVAALLLVLVAVILPTRLRLSSDLNALPGLRRDLEARQSDVTVLRANLGTLIQEAKRQVRWAEVLTVLSQQIPPTLKLEVVDATRAVAPGQGSQPKSGAPAPESTLRIKSLTPLQPGSQPLLDVARFVAGLMREPAVNKRFQLKTWEIKPAQAPAQGGPQFLDVSIVLTERPE